MYKVITEDIYVTTYSLRSELLVAEMNVSRHILVLDTSIFKTTNSEQRKYMTLPIMKVIT